MVETCLPVDEPEILNSNEMSSERYKRSDGHQEVAQKDKASTYSTDRASSRAFSERIEETSRSSASFIHRE